MKHTITLHVNAERWTVEVDPNETLLVVLRDKLGIKSPKIGCERGDCGSCTILLDGKAVRSCLILGMEAEGHTITTVEHLSTDGLTPLQQAFVDKNAFQCGFCAPGIVLAATELLDKTSTPTIEEIKESISGNLCRCTGYAAILEAIQEVSKQRQSPKKGV